ncbi:unnamed protein product [Macrosiphum euphorbiae]|uniref:Integrase catalytic domain-containing protein n=1 Tax=Macrosiphum euphorbiae TaxID=13131 RepID=A0AAV0Y184_9HEMI|nr:unnamed protein product [Macrosiphum euphorbiae]
MGVYDEAKVRITDLQKRAKRIYDAGEVMVGKEPTKTDRTRFRIMYATLENLNTDFESQLSVIIRNMGKPGVEVVDADKLREDFETVYFGCKILADEYLPESNTHIGLNDTFIEQKPSVSPANFLPIEKLPIPKFKGDPKEYTSFRNMFDIYIHDNPHIKPVLKFGYLKRYLEGEPLRLVGNLMLTDRNYELALSQLKARYSNRRIITESHLDELFNAPKAFLGNGISIRNLLNVVTETIGALENLTYAVDQWDPILLHVLQKKLDQQLRAQWELSVDTTEDPSEFIVFLTKFCKSAMTGPTNSVYEKSSTKSKFTKPTTLFSSQSGTYGSPEKTSQQDPREKRSFSCQVCKLQPGHLLVHCSQFKKNSPKERHQIIKDLNRCFLCFSEHLASQCKSTKSCVQCGKRHHSLLHLSDTDRPIDEPEATTSAHVTVAAAKVKHCHASILLSTALVKVQNENGEVITVRALLDSASQSSFITESCVYRLGLSREKTKVTVQALSGTQVPVVRGSTTITVRPVRHDSPKLEVNVLILPRITGPIPTNRIQISPWPHIEGLNLADPEYYEPLPVDLLLGADVFPYVVSGEKKEDSITQPIALSTVFGWVLMGTTSNTPTKMSVTMCATTESVDRTLQRFLDIEDVPTVVKSSPDEEECERIYTTTTSRQPCGRYKVHLPFKPNPPVLGDSRDQAAQRLFQLEKRLEKSPELRNEYNEAMRDYLRTGHMRKVDPTLTDSQASYYIPHQAVIRPESSTTKMRIVFDASAKTSSGRSLNDNLLCGPKLQQDLPSIVLRFRLHAIVFTTDVKQMFRQIVVTEPHRPYQRLLYRFNLNEPIQEYEMNIVTFGQKSSPFLAIRTLHQLAQDEAATDQAIKTIIQRDLYVDDVTTGTNTEEEAYVLQQKLITIFAKGQFELRKWASNSAKFLGKIPEEHQQTSSKSFNEHGSDYTKVLGLNWEPAADLLSYKYQPNPIKFSKRAILSEIARIYDPLGLLAPVTADLKRLMKYLWIAEVGWDQPIPEEAATLWTKYHEELPALASLRIPRRVTSSNATYELHGFSDSSEAAYAAAVYLRVDSGTEVQCQLLMGKSKVSPATKLSIPRLELCGAWLLARLLAYVRPNVATLNISNVTAWTDSTVALAWIRSPTAKLKTFVANRAAKIQQNTDVGNWRHVPTSVNPADCASRGLSPNRLASHSLWWNGPNFLRQPEHLWPQELPMNPTNHRDEELEENPITLVVRVKTKECPLLYQSDNFPKILRLTAYWLRVRNYLSNKRTSMLTTLPTAEEIEQAVKAQVRWTQQVAFYDEFCSLEAGKSCSVRLRKLAPFLDDDKLLRVGGRLKHAQIPYKEKYPLLLPKTSRLTTLLIDYVHRENGHPGPQALQNILSQDYWILSARSIIRQRTHRCIPCFRAKPSVLQPVMGNLPVHRVSQIKPFGRAGVDFAGPFEVKAAMLRKIKITKAYICIFICMATTAVHIELVSDLSTPLFISALSRFISRRGRCSDIHSDCGTNFVGTQKYLQNIDHILRHDTFVNHLTSHQITWHFNPPAAPHMGGLWEAAVKSTKTLLHRITNGKVLTYEELNTILHQVEATLNSRPLSAMSADPSDFKTLTAGHFLTMEPLVPIPSIPTTTDSSQNLTVTLRNRWALIQQIQNHFWNRWHREYLHTLQERPKWNRVTVNIRLGALVILKEPTPPLTWKTARVVEICPGPDGVVRVTKVRTANGKIFTRPVVKLCPLPL